MFYFIFGSFLNFITNRSLKNNKIQRLIMKNFYLKKIIYFYFSHVYNFFSRLVIELILNLVTINYLTVCGL